MEFDKEQMDAIAGLAKKTLAEFVKSDDFTGTLNEAMKSAASEVVNKAITAKSKPQEDRLLSKVAELIKEAVPVKDDDDKSGDKDTQGDAEAAILKSKAYRTLNKKHETLSDEMDAERAKREAVEVQAFNNERDAALISLASKGNAIDPELVRDALRAGVSRDEDGFLVVKTTKDGEETAQPLQEVVETHLKARPFLVKASDGGGAGSGGGSGGGAGGGGEGEEITKEDLKDPKKYAELRAAGKIPGVPAPPKSA